MLKWDTYLINLPWRFQPIMFNWACVFPQRRFWEGKSHWVRGEQEMRFWRGTLAGASSMCLDWMSVILLKPSLSLEYKFLSAQSCFLASLTWRSPPLFAGTIQTIQSFYKLQLPPTFGNCGIVGNNNSERQACLPRVDLAQKLRLCQNSNFVWIKTERLLDS